MSATSDEAIHWANRLATEEGLLVGPSTGAACKVANDIACSDEAAGKTVVVIFPSAGIRCARQPNKGPVMSVSYLIVHLIGSRGDPSSAGMLLTQCGLKQNKRPLRSSHRHRISRMRLQWFDGNPRLMCTQKSSPRPLIPPEEMSACDCRVIESSMVCWKLPTTDLQWTQSARNPSEDKKHNHVMSIFL